MQTGKVKWFNSKGMVLSHLSGDKDVFVHYSAVKELTNLVEGQKVSFEVAENKGKMAAANLKLED